MNRPFLNVMILSWGFMLVFTAFQTMGNIEVRRGNYALLLLSLSSRLPRFPSRKSASLGGRSFATLGKVGLARSRELDFTLERIPAFERRWIFFSRTPSAFPRDGADDSERSKLVFVITAARTSDRSINLRSYSCEFFFLPSNPTPIALKTNPSLILSRLTRDVRHARDTLARLETILVTQRPTKL